MERLHRGQREYSKMWGDPHYSSSSVLGYLQSHRRSSTADQKWKIKILSPAMLLIDRLVLSQVDDKNETKSISESDDLRFMALSLLNWSLRPRDSCVVYVLSIGTRRLYPGISYWNPTTYTTQNQPAQQWTLLLFLLGHAWWMIIR